VAVTRNPAIKRDDGVMNSEDKFARWHWKAAIAKERGSIATARQYEFRLIHWYVPADAERFPYVEGHQFMLEWRDLFYPEGLGGGSREKFITEDFRRDVAVVRTQGVAGVPFWTEHIDDGLSVHVALAAPEQRFGDAADDNVFRVSYQFGGQRWYVARYDPSRAELSAVVATELS
jgi:hypothetical protein